MLNRQKSLLPLLINDRCKSVILLRNFLDDFLFNAFLLEDRVLHLGALRESGLCLAKQLLELIDLVGTRLLKGHTSATTAM